MRLGILEFGAGAETATLAETLRAQDIDIVVSEEPITTGIIAAREVGRLGRADCDGVLLFVVDADAIAFIAQAALYFHCPLLLTGNTLPLIADAAGALADVGVSFDRLIQDENSSQMVTNWLTANRKTERQPGIEAALKLYGQRMSVAGSPITPVDSALWLRQFGIAIIPSGEESDISVADGDVHTAFCAHLMHLLSSTEPQVISIDSPLPADHTFVQIARCSGRFVCFFGHTDTGNAQHLPLLSGKLVIVPGDHRTAIKAACHTLDIAIHSK